MNFFKTKQKTPTELIRGLKEYLIRLDSNTTELRRKANEDISKSLSLIKLLLYGDSETESLPEITAQLAQEIYANDLLHLLVLNLYRLEFEARKEVTLIFSILLRRQIGSRYPTVEYLTNKPDTLFTTFKSYENPEIALNTGMILREMLRYEPLAKILLYDDLFIKFIDFIELTTFGIACDAQANFKEILTRHKIMVATFLSNHYQLFSSTFLSLIQSTNYVTKRQSLKLLGEILLDRTNFSTMNKFIGEEENLKVLMILLRDKSKNIQFEAFHVFKVFVANPNKQLPISIILKRNQSKLIEFLRGFHNERDDDQFKDEKAFLITQIEAL